MRRGYQIEVGLVETSEGPLRAVHVQVICFISQTKRTVPD